MIRMCFFSPFLIINDKNQGQVLQKTINEAQLVIMIMFIYFIYFIYTLFKVDLHITLQ